jgi:hypothetical protein
MPRNYLAGTAGHIINAVLAAVEYNFLKPIAKPFLLRLGLCKNFPKVYFGAFGPLKNRTGARPK